MSGTPLEEVSDYEVVQLAIDMRMVDVHTSFPAKVEAFDASKQTVDVVPALNRSLPDGQGNWTTEKLPKLGAVPVCFPRCGEFFMSFPIKAGDYVLVVCAERNIGMWRSTGNQGDPCDLGMHALDGAIAIPGVFPDTKLLSSVSDSTMMLGKDGASAAQIEITDSLVKLGGGAQFIALANLVDQRISAIRTLLNAHIHSGGTISGNTGAPTTTLPSQSSTAAQNVKAT